MTYIIAEIGINHNGDMDIAKELIDTVTSQAKPSDIKIVLEYALSGDFQNAREKLLDVMLKDL